MSRDRRERRQKPWLEGLYSQGLYSQRLGRRFGKRNGLARTVRQAPFNIGRIGVKQSWQALQSRAGYGKSCREAEITAEAAACGAPCQPYKRLKNIDFICE